MMKRTKKKKNRRQGKNIDAPSTYDNLDLMPRLELPELPTYQPDPASNRPRVAIVACSQTDLSELRALEAALNMHGVTVILPDRSN